MSVDGESLVRQLRSVALRSQDVSQDQRSRAALLQAARELVAVLEQPDELVSSVGYGGGRNICVRLGIDMRLFEVLSASEQPLTAEQLAAECRAEEGLVVRVARTLVGMGFVAEMRLPDGKCAFTPTPTTRQMTKPSVQASIKFFHDQELPILAATPAYFKANGYRLPQSQTDGPFQFAHETDEDCYTYWSKQPGVMENFNTFMNGVFGSPGRLHWTEWCPFDRVCFDGLDAKKGSEYTWVDVGGGKGHRVQQMVDKYPAVRGKFAVQDLPFVIEEVATSGVKISPHIELMPHNFLQPQPIKGARTYSLATILHNRADPVCRTILARLREAMTRGYSKLYRPIW